MRRFFPFLIIVALVCGLFCACDVKEEYSFENKDKPKSTNNEFKLTEDAKLFVFGAEVPECGLYINFGEKYALLPVTTVLEAMGVEMELEWESETLAVITHDGNRYIMDTAIPSVTKEGSGDFNYILPAPGGTLRYQAMDYELLLDTASFESLAMSFGPRIIWRINYQSRTVEINLFGDAFKN